MALNTELKSKAVTIFNKNLLDPDSPDSDEDIGNTQIDDPDNSNADPADTDLTKPVERDLYDDFYPDDNPDDPDPGLYQIIPDTKRKGYQ